MADVIPFPDHKGPHLSGRAICKECGHEWVAVAPVGTVELKCPKCHTMKGIWKNPCVPEHGEIWCCNCGCDVFSVTRKGIMCWRCGEYQDFGKE